MKHLNKILMKNSIQNTGNSLQTGMRIAIAALVMVFICSNSLKAQTDTTATDSEFDQLISNMQTDQDSIQKTEKSDSDTLKVRLGNANVKIVTKDNKAHIDVETDDSDVNRKWNKYDKDYERTHKPKVKRSRKKFDGHWDAMEFGGNLFDKTDYQTLYPVRNYDFMETSPEKGIEFNLNFAEYSFGFGSYMGIVTGLGINWNNYRFKNNNTIIKDENGMIQAVDLPTEDFRKSKLTTIYLTAPLMFEFQIPGNYGQNRLFVAGGVIGGVKIGEYTKYKIGKEKSKNKGDFNLSPFRWGYTARIGFDDFGIYATYYNTPLFIDGKGPATTPYTVGITCSF